MPARDKTEASVDVACVTRGMPDLQRLDDSYFAFVSTEKLYPRSVARGSNIERFRNRSSTQWIRLLTMFTERRAVVLQIVFINLLVSDSGRIFERVHSTLKQWKEDGRFVLANRLAYLSKIDDGENRIFGWFESIMKGTVAIFSTCLRVSLFSKITRQPMASRSKMS